MANTDPTVLLIVRGLKTALSREEFERRYKERLPRFKEFEGLLQKYYAYDERTEEWAGFYFWDSEKSLAKYLESDLRKSIPAAYELTEPPRIEHLRIIEVLRPAGERG